MGKTLQNMITRSKQGLTKRYQNKRLTPNTNYAHMPADMHIVVYIAIGIAPAFTSSLCESEYSRRPQKRIIRSLGVSHKNKKATL